MKKELLANARWHHSAISVRNMETMVAFYRDILGFEVEWQIDHIKAEMIDTIVGLKDVDVHTAMLIGYGTRIELFQYHQPRGEEQQRRQCDFGYTHICLLVKDAVALYEALLAEGMTFVSPPQNHRPDGWCCYMRDPEGNFIELLTRKDQL